MKLSELEAALAGMEAANFIQPDGIAVPSHYHVTEVGQYQKSFIDCGGKIRHETSISLQLFTASDTDHRLSAEKLRKIIRLSIDKLHLPDAEVEVEYQTSTIGKFSLEVRDNAFHLVPMATQCLASDACGIPAEASVAACAPGSGCC